MRRIIFMSHVLIVQNLEKRFFLYDLNSFFKDKTKKKTTRTTKIMLQFKYKYNIKKYKTQIFIM